MKKLWAWIKRWFVGGNTEPVAPTVSSPLIMTRTPIVPRQEYVPQNVKRVKRDDRPRRQPPTLRQSLTSVNNPAQASSDSGLVDAMILASVLSNVNASSHHQVSSCDAPEERFSGGGGSFSGGGASDSWSSSSSDSGSSSSSSD